MKNKSFYFAIALALLSIISCQKDEDNRDRVSFGLQVSDNYTNGNSKNYLDPSDNKPKFYEDEAIKINGETYLVDCRTGSPMVYDVIKSTKYYAVYPASWVDDAYASSEPNITFPNTQKYSEKDGHQYLESPMSAYSDGGESTLVFHNIAALATVKITNKYSSGDAKLHVKYVTIRTTSTPLAGTGKIKDITTNTPYIELNNGSCNATIDCTTTGGLANEGKLEVTLVIPPIDNKTLYVDILFTDDSGKKYSFRSHSGTSKSIGRSQQGSIPVTLTSDNVNEDGEFWGAGTSAENPFMITCYADLNKLRELVNSATGDNATKYNSSAAYYLQTANIDIAEGSGVPTNNWCKTSYPAIGKNPSYPFKAHYDGGGHSITNMFAKTSIDSVSSATGLFGFADGATISNLTVEGYLKSSFAKPNNRRIHIGGVVGSVINHSVTISKCTSAVNITVSQTSTTPQVSHSNVGVGGILGQADVACTVSNCYATSVIRDSNYVINGVLGGIVGRNISASGIYISGCTFAGRLLDGTINSTLTGTNYGTLGGILGRAEGASTTIIGCHNKGTISSIQSSSQVVSIGGIMGRAEYLNGTDILTTITNCSNDAEGIVQMINKTASSAKVGGILGYSNGYNSGSTYYYANCNITGCYNYGSVLGSTTSNTSNATGGIVGLANVGDIDISSCENAGTGIVEGYNAVGGIMGSGTKTTTTISNCTNKGTITAAKKSGGIFGDYQSGNLSVLSISDCTNNSAILGSDEKVGGIAGQAYTGANFTNCTNTASVTGTQSVGGILGWLGTKGTFNHCLNSGDVSITGSNDNSYIGGIIGMTSGATTSPGVVIKNCGNTGDISGKNICGGIIGYHYPNNSTNAIYAHIYNCYVRDCSISVSNTSTGYAGGLIGQYNNNSSTTYYYMSIHNCYVSASITYLASPGAYRGVLYGTKSTSYKVYTHENYVNETMSATKQYNYDTHTPILVSDDNPFTIPSTSIDGNDYTNMVSALNKRRELINGGTYFNSGESSYISNFTDLKQWKVKTVTENDVEKKLVIFDGD